MNKITSVAALAVLASVSLSGNAATAGVTAVATTGTSFTISTSTSSSDVGYGLKDNVTIQLSAGNLGIVDYNATGNVYGYAVGSTKGKGKIYSAASTGGAIVEDSTATAGAVPSANDITGKAQVRSGTTGSSTSTTSTTTTTTGG